MKPNMQAAVQVGVFSWQTLAVLLKVLEAIIGALKGQTPVGKHIEAIEAAATPRTSPDAPPALPK